MTELSAAARAVLAAVTQSQYYLEPEDVPNEAARIACEAAAALRAAADQVVPMALCVHNDDFVYVRHQLHTIAAELEAQ